MSSVSVMKRWEERLVGHCSDSNASFYRGGEVDEWNSLFDVRQRERMMEISEIAMRAAGYDGT